MAKLSINSKWTDGSLLFYDCQTQARVLAMFNDNHAPRFTSSLLPAAHRGSPDHIMDRVEHFAFLSEDEWTNSKTGAGTSALADAHGGVLLMSPAAADRDEEVMAHDACTVIPGGLFDIWFLCRLQVDDIDKVELNAGLMIADAKVGKHHAAGGGVNDGIYFNSPFNLSTINGICTTGGVDTAQACGAMGDGAYSVLGFHYDASAGAVQFNHDGTNYGAPIVANVPLGVPLKVTFAVQEGEAVLHTMRVDWYRLFVQAG